ncbi:hypothetical protein RRG08_008276 [Elysia crispata]|uniref:Uncharacterized protein n=1 Tax=Elysia crispata TaxID=231223 RepID=A0AAE0ZMM6_9GAST|nr:hypothetical protein RRG08_008276 [Elysia crispata]
MFCGVTTAIQSDLSGNDSTEFICLIDSSSDNDLPIISSLCRAALKSPPHVPRQFSRRPSQILRYFRVVCRHLIHLHSTGDNLKPHVPTPGQLLIKLESLKEKVFDPFRSKLRMCILVRDSK